MTRLRIPACKLRGDQMRALGALSKQVAGGYSHVTTRGNLQMREIPPSQIMNLFYGLSDCGLSSINSGADSARNITCSPSAGFDREELIDLSAYAIELNHVIKNTKDFNGIPRKFNFVFDNGGSMSVVSGTNDVAFIACQVSEGAGIDPGIYCRIAVGGITGHGDFARETYRLVKPEQLVDTAAALMQVFVEQGTRDARGKARLKYLLEAIGDQGYIDAGQALLPFEIPSVAAEYIIPAKPMNRLAHIGPHPQAQAGYSYLGIALSVGRLEADDMELIGKLAQDYGHNDVRLTVWQNAIIPYIKNEDIDTVIGILADHGLSCKATSLEAGLIACTGNAGCKYAGADTKRHGKELIAYLNTVIELQHPINIHVTGCHHSCAQHYIGDIGLMGGQAKNAAGETCEGFHVVIGGGADADQAIATTITDQALDVPRVQQLIQHLLEYYIAETQQDISFTAWIKDQDAAAVGQRCMAMVA